jgi:hypothetical protein
MLLLEDSAKLLMNEENFLIKNNSLTSSKIAPLESTVSIFVRNWKSSVHLEGVREGV